MLRKNPDSAADVEIGVDDCWAYFNLVANWKGDGRTDDFLIHGTGQHSLWSILGGMQVTASLASDEFVGVWTSLRTSEALGYSTLAHYGQNTWARVAICFEPPVTKENLFSGHPALMGVKRGAQRVEDCPYRIRCMRIALHHWVEILQVAIATRCAELHPLRIRCRMLQVDADSAEAEPRVRNRPLGSSLHAHQCRVT